ncbi:MAG: hypothetical protein AAF974_03960 [Cyanobacteria bacterium P01_E01_bin.34]
MPTNPSDDRFYPDIFAGQFTQIFGSLQHFNTIRSCWASGITGAIAN